MADIQQSKIVTLSKKSYRSGLAAVNCHTDFSLQVGFEEIFEGVVVLVQPRLPDGHDEVEEGFESGSRSRRILLNPQNVVTLSSSTRDFGTLASSHCTGFLDPKVPANSTKVIKKFD